MVPSTTALTLNMQLPNIATVAWAVQGDTLARKIQATLIDGSTAWTPPTGAAGVIRYFKPDGTNGVYDVDEAGDPAVVWSGNVATITIVQQALTVPGTVKMQLEFYDTNSQRLSAFGWCMNVEPSAVTDNEFLSADYYNILSEQIAAVLAAAGAATPGEALPLMDGTAAPGTALPYSRQDHVHPTDTSRAAASVLATYTRPNLLDNWLFDAQVINQRDQTAYTSTGTTIDRWKLTAAGRFGISSGGTYWRLGSSTGSSTLKQILPYTITGPVTLSVYIPYISGTLKLWAQKEDSSYVGINITTTGVHSYTFAEGIAAFTLYADVGNYIDIYACKLEVGTTQTLAHLENGSWILNELPDRTQQLINCQRYLFALSGVMRVRAGFVGTGEIQFCLPCPPQFRADATAASILDSTGMVVRAINSATDQTGFTFTALSRGTPMPCLTISAAKANHGLTDAQLVIASVNTRVLISKEP